MTRDTAQSYPSWVYLCAAVVMLAFAACAPEGGGSSCGNGSCERDESCGTCGQDCGECPPVGDTLDIDLGGGLTLTMVRIPVGTFQMGTEITDDYRLKNSRPVHTVTISEPFYMGLTEVTQAQWRAVMGNEPWSGQEWTIDPDNPAASPASYVSWSDARAFCAAVETATGYALRLPSEAEWEYACRAGTTTEYSFGDDPAGVSDYAWWTGNTREIGEWYGHAVAQRLPNPWGLYDMHGNVLEWCEDCWHEDYQGAPANGEAWADACNDPYGGGLFVCRGGSWWRASHPGQAYQDVRSALRGCSSDRRDYEHGFRVAIDAANVPTPQPDDNPDPSDEEISLVDITGRVTLSEGSGLDLATTGVRGALGGTVSVAQDGSFQIEMNEEATGLLELVDENGTVLLMSVVPKHPLLTPEPSTTSRAREINGGPTPFSTAQSLVMLQPGVTVSDPLLAHALLTIIADLPETQSLSDVIDRKLAEGKRPAEEPDAEVLDAIGEVVEALRAQAATYAPSKSAARYRATADTSSVHFEPDPGTIDKVWIWATFDFDANTATFDATNTLGRWVKLVLENDAGQERVVGWLPPGSMRLPGLGEMLYETASSLFTGESLWEKAKSGLRDMYAGTHDKTFAGVDLTGFETGRLATYAWPAPHQLDEVNVWASGGLTILTEIIVPAASLLADVKIAADIGKAWQTQDTELMVRVMGESYAKIQEAAAKFLAGDQLDGMKLMWNVVVGITGNEELWVLLAQKTRIGSHQLGKKLASRVLAALTKINTITHSVNLGLALADWLWISGVEDGIDRYNLSVASECYGTPPIADADSVSLSAVLPITITLKGTDPDPGPESLKYIITALPQHGELTDLADAFGSVTLGSAPYTLGSNEVLYSPSAEFTADEFKFAASDGCAQGAEATISLSKQSSPDGGGDLPCGDGTCDPDEDCCSCADDCDPCCGNGACDCGETEDSCPEDCSSSQSGDDYEPDNNYSEASVIAGGETQTHSLVPAGDEDWLQFTVAVSGDYTIETSSGTLADTCMYLYGPDSWSDLVAEDDDGGEGVAARIDRALEPGTYYVKVKGRSSSDTGNYMIGVSGGEADELWEVVQLSGEGLVAQSITTDGSSLAWAVYSDPDDYYAAMRVYLYDGNGSPRLIRETPREVSVRYLRVCGSRAAWAESGGTHEHLYLHSAGGTTLLHTGREIIYAPVLTDDLAVCSVHDAEAWYRVYVYDNSSEPQMVAEGWDPGVAGEGEVPIGVGIYDVGVLVSWRHQHGFYDNATNELRLYDLHEPGSFELLASTNNYQERYLMVSEDESFLVWAEMETGNDKFSFARLMYYDDGAFRLDTEVSRLVALHWRQPEWKQFSVRNGRVAWVGFDGNDREIFLCSKGGTAQALTNNDAHDGGLQSTNEAVFWYTNDSGQYRLMRWHEDGLPWTPPEVSIADYRARGSVAAWRSSDYPREPGDRTPAFVLYDGHRAQPVAYAYLDCWSHSFEDDCWGVLEWPAIYWQENDMLFLARPR